jgi:aminoglycoside 6'-N-acetyltransferase I
MTRIGRATAADAGDWLRLRVALWPHAEAESPAEIAEILESPDLSAFIARDEAGAAIGLAEVAIRRDYVNGCETSPAGFLEGIFVVPAARRQGVARALVDAAAQWVRAQGCTEFASDADIANDASHRMHAALGFAETQRVVYFRKLV